jgi:signal transduction histidine kinase
VTFTHGKLADAMNLSEEVAGISRLGPNGELLVEVGVSLPERGLWPIPPGDSKEATVRGPVLIGSSPYLLVGAHLFGESPGRVGADIVVFKIDRLRQIVTDYTGLGITGETVLGVPEGEQIHLFFPSRRMGSATIEAVSRESSLGFTLEKSKRNQSGIAIQQDVADTPVIIAFSPVNGAEWGIVVKMDAEELYLSINHQIVLIAIAILALMLLGTFGTVLLLRPLTGALHKEILVRKKAEKEIMQHRDHLEELVSKRTGELEASNRELESYSYTIAHDLRSPLRSIAGFSQILQEDAGHKLNADEKDCFERIITASKRMAELIDDILELGQVTRSETQYTEVDLTALAKATVERLCPAGENREVDWKIQEGLVAVGDIKLLALLLDNLLGNACKYSSRKTHAHIEFGSTVVEEGGDENSVYFVRDNGVGFDMQYVDKLFKPFHRLHSDVVFEGTGIGLATVQRIIHRHGGHIWAEAEPDKGATFYFTLPNAERMSGGNSKASCN